MFPLSDVPNPETVSTSFSSQKVLAAFPGFPSLLTDNLDVDGFMEEHGRPMAFSPHVFWKHTSRAPTMNTQGLRACPAQCRPLTGHCYQKQGYLDTGLILHEWMSRGTKIESQSTIKFMLAKGLEIGFLF